MRKVLVAAVFGILMAVAIAPTADASIITKYRQYLCGHTIRRHPCWDTVKYRVCYREGHRHLGCTPWRIYATWG